MTATIPRRSMVPALATAVALLLAACQGAGSGASDEPTAAPSVSLAASEAPLSEAPEPSEAAEASEAASEEPMGDDGIVRVTDSALGEILTDAEGNTLYLFTNDPPNESACSDGCAATWPPLTAASEAEAVAGAGVTGELGVIEREDGSLQVIIGGVPLYTYAADAEPGDLSGHQVGGVWFAVTPDGEAAGDEAGQTDYEY